MVVPASRNVLVTGASRGIGLALCSALLARGDHVLGVTRPGSNADELTALGHDTDGRLSVQRLDVTDQADLERLGRAVTDEVDHLDLLVNNAGVMEDDESIETLDRAELEQSYLINAVTPALVVQSLLPSLRAADSALVLNMSSSFASIALKNADMPPRYSYAMSKAAVNMLSKTLALELAGDDVLVVAVHPGWVRTEIGGPDAQLSADEAAASLVELADRVTPELSGSFMMAPDRSLPW